MAKNMIRKNLAIATASAFVLSTVAGMPANAAGLDDKTKVSLAPTTGTEYSVIAGKDNTFSLTSNEAANIVGGDVSFLITDADEQTFIATTSTGVAEVDIDTAGDDSYEIADGVLTITMGDNAVDGITAGDMIFLNKEGFNNDILTGYYTVVAQDADANTLTVNVPGQDNVAAGTAAAVDADAIVTLADADGNALARGDGQFVFDSGAANAGADEALVLIVQNSDSATVTVTAWVDDNNDGDIDATEYTSPTRTVKFLDKDELTVDTLTWTAVLTADAVSVDATFDQSVNWDQALSNLDGVFTNASDTFTAAAEAEDDGVVTFAADVDDNSLAADRLTLTISNDSSESVHVARYAVADTDVTDLNISVSDSDNLSLATDLSAITARAGTTRSEVTVTAVDADGDAVSGVVVQVSDAGNTAVGAGAEVTVGGKAIDPDTDTFAAFTLVTDSNGEATIVIVSDDGTAGEVVDLAVEAEGVAVDVDNNSTADITLTYTAAAYTGTITSLIQASEDADDPTGLQSTDGIAIGSGGSYSTALRVVDQWGVGPDAGDYRVKATINTVDADGDKNEFVSVASSGSATHVVRDAIEDETEIEVTYTLEVWDADAANWGAADNAAIDALYFNTAALVDAVVTIDNAAGGAADITLHALAAASEQLGDSDPTISGGVRGDSEILTGQLDATDNGAALNGYAVTISGSANLLFAAGDAADNAIANLTDYAFGSLTALASSDEGTFHFAVFSNVPGEYDITISSNGASETYTLEFNAAAAGTATSATVNVANATPGKTMTVSGVVTDAFGNVVNNDAGDIEITYDGPGFIVGNLPTETDANGAYKFNVLLGSNDVVTGTVTVAVDGNSDGDFTDDNDFEVSADLAPAAPAADTKVNAGSFKGYVAIYAKGHAGKRLSAKVGNDWVVVPALASNFVRVVEYTGAGYTISVRIYIDRVLVDTIVVTTK